MESEKDRSTIESRMITAQWQLALRSLSLDIDPEVEAQTGEHTTEIMEWVNAHSAHFRAFTGVCDPELMNSYLSDNQAGLPALYQAFMEYESAQMKEAA